MKPDEIDEIWKRACAPLKDALAEVSYETWIATLKPIDAVGDRFLLEASTPFHRNMITSRYSELVRGHPPRLRAGSLPARRNRRR